MKTLITSLLMDAPCRKGGLKVAFFALVSLFSFEIYAQNSSPHFMAEGAVHDELFTEGFDLTQARANAFIFEGKHDEYFKFEKHARLKLNKIYKSLYAKVKVEDEDEKKDIIYKKIEQYKQKKGLQKNPFPRHRYVVIIKPSFKPVAGFAVDEDKLVFMSSSMKNPKKPSSKIIISSSTTKVPKDLCQSLRGLMDNIINSAKVSDRGSNILDGTSYYVIAGPMPTHMVSSNLTGDVTRKTAIELLQRICDAAKANDDAAIADQLQEIKRLSAVYQELR